MRVHIPQPSATEPLCQGVSSAELRNSRVSEEKRGRPTKEYPPYTPTASPRRTATNRGKSRRASSLPGGGGCLARGGGGSGRGAARGYSIIPGKTSRPEQKLMGGGGQWGRAAKSSQRTRRPIRSPPARDAQPPPGPCSCGGSRAWGPVLPGGRGLRASLLPGIRGQK